MERVIEFNQIYNEDCISGMKRMQKQGVKADFLITDIPYGEVNMASNGLRELDRGVADLVTFDLQQFVDTALKVVKGSFVIFCGWEQVSQLVCLFRAAGLSVRLMVWEKTNPMPMNGEHLYLSGIEMAVYAKRSGAAFNAYCKNTVFKKPIPKNQIHPTQKPYELFREIIEDNTNEGDIVLDTCAGSGTTAVAARKTNRKYICFELSKEYCDLAQDRVQDAFMQLSMLYD